MVYGLLDCKTVRIFCVFKCARAVKQKVWNEALFLFFQLLTWTSSGNSVDTTEESALKLTKIATFESDLLKINEDIAPQISEILQTFILWWGRGGGTNLPHPTIQTSVNCHNFAELYLRSLKTNHFQIWQF